MDGAFLKETVIQPIQSAWGRDYDYLITELSQLESNVSSIVSSIFRHVLIWFSPGWEFPRKTFDSNHGTIFGEANVSRQFQRLIHIQTETQKPGH